MNRTGRADEMAPTQTDISVVVHSRNVIGESPIWCPTKQQLYLVDISGRENPHLPSCRRQLPHFQHTRLGDVVVDAGQGRARTHHAQDLCLL